MVKMFALLRRNPALSRDEFVAHWRDNHGPLIAGTPELARHIVRYEQHPRHRDDGLSGTDDVDGVAVQWFRSIDDFAAFISEPGYGELIAPDERRFLDMSRVEFIITDEPNIVIDGTRSDVEGGAAGTAPA
ncbi:MAG: EthD domain-containing protein [Microthrixaceae bacterium]